MRVTDEVINSLAEAASGWDDTQLTREPLKQHLERFQQHLAAAFDAGEDVATLIDARTLFIDTLLRRLWRFYGFEARDGISLVAVGGFGRGELHPLSDIDLLILSRTALDEQAAAAASELLTLLWDLKLEVGHSVR
ncbi:MAG: nucleotidyltransferase domain-containing protein, partial [Pantoea sp.]|nr:nucleotidyltransferase domain-containing protein [Pantoea sp.]